jgi:hypothetical protein
MMCVARSDQHIHTCVCVLRATCSGCSGPLLRVEALMVQRFLELRANATAAAAAAAITPVKQAPRAP